MKKSKLIYFLPIKTIISLKIEELKKYNIKLRNKIKELNKVVEQALEKANNKKIYNV